MIEPVHPIVEIRVRADSISRYTTLLQSGVDITTAGIDSIQDFIEHLPGFSADYINNRVQTIFLNGTAMDNLAAPIAGDNPVLALSAAMPGLAGAILRRNSPHAALRTTKTQTAGASSDKRETKTVKVKLFNVIATEKGERLLAQGVGFTGNQLADFLTGHPDLLTSITRTAVAGHDLAKDDLIERLQAAGTIHLIIKADHD